MIASFIVAEGKIKLVLSPSNPSEKTLLGDLFSKPIVATLENTTQIVNKTYPDSIIIVQQEIPKEKGPVS